MAQSVSKINEMTKGKLGDGRGFSYRTVILKKGSYPNEGALINGVIFTVLNADEIYQYRNGSACPCFVVMQPDHPDSDDLELYIILEKAKKERPTKIVDINKKSEIQVDLTENELEARYGYVLP